MTHHELLAKAGRKVAAEYKPETIEFLFRPTNVGELMLRLNYEWRAAIDREYIYRTATRRWR